MSKVNQEIMFSLDSRVMGRCNELKQLIEGHSNALPADVAEYMYNLAEAIQRDVREVVGDFVQN